MQFTNEMCRIRDKQKLIVDGEIERAHCVGGQAAYGAVPGKRKLMLKDAKIIAKGAVGAINRAIQEFEDSDPERRGAAF